MMEVRICQLHELEEPASLETNLPGDGENSAIFVVRINGQIRAYVNSCPHTGAPLNWLPDQFLDYHGELIQCSIHGAQFRPVDGHCIRGPCQGQSLRAVPVEIRGDAVYVKYGDG